MKSPDSFYPDKHLSTSGRITQYERKKRLEARKKMAVDIFRLRQRGISVKQILKRYNLKPTAYATLLREGKEHYNNMKISKKKR